MRVEHIRKYKPQPNEKAVRIDRATPLGNPFHIGRDGDRDAVCDKHADLLANSPALQELARTKLAGADVLLCWCAPQRCHGQNYVEFMSVPSRA